MDTSEEFSPDFAGLQAIVRRLRGPDGCPWDIKQTALTLKKYLLEETQELAEAIDIGDTHQIHEELGDLFFILAMLLHIQSEAYPHSENETFALICEKMIRRHPHVFAGKEVGSEEELRQQWEGIKAREKGQL
jgi:uncharacterized protein YabN with tetrapyrrole methylase and pyrophosphatase domain